MSVNEMQDEGLSIRGSLSESSLHELLSSISRSKETGTLNFHDMGRWKAIYFKEGQIIFATSNIPDDRLGEYLIKKGRITVRQFLEGSKLVRPGKRFGAVLVEENILSSDELLAALQGHVEEIVYSLFDWVRGEYEFVIKDLSAEGPITLNLNTEDVILEGIRRIDDFTRIYTGLGSMDRVLRLSDSADNLMYRLELDSDESQILSLVNGTLSLEQILALSFLPNFETLRILYALVAVGVLERAGETAERGKKQLVEQEYELEEIVEHYNCNFGTVASYLQGRLGDRAGEFADRIVAQVSEQHSELFEGIDLSSASRVDFDQLLANLGDRPHEAKKSTLVDGLNELTYGLLLEIGRQFGREEQDKISAMIQRQSHH
jgi:hypothetical protein